MRPANLPSQPLLTLTALGPWLPKLSSFLVRVVTISISDSHHLMKMKVVANFPDP